MILEDENNIDILFLAQFKKFILKSLVFKINAKKLELPINRTFDLKFSYSTGGEWNLVYKR